MNFRNLDHFSTSRIKALFGFHPMVLAELLFKVLPELEQRRRERPLRSTRPETAVCAQRRTITGGSADGQGDGRTLIYLRHNVSHEVVGALFGFGAERSENAFEEVVPTWRERVSSLRSGRLRSDRRRGEPTWTPLSADRQRTTWTRPLWTASRRRCAVPRHRCDRQGVFRRRNAIGSGRRWSPTRTEKF